MGVTGVKPWPGHVSGHVFDDLTTRCGDNRADCATLKETAEQDAHLLPPSDTFPATKANFLVHYFGVEGANLLTRVPNHVCLLSNILVPRAHFVELLVGGISPGFEGPAVAELLSERLLPSTDGLQAFPNVRNMTGE